MKCGDCFGCKMKNRGPCEVALRKKTPEGIFIDKQTKLPTEINFPRNFVLHLKSEGTAFVFKKLPVPIAIQKLSLYAVAFVLSSAHVVCSSLTLEPRITFIQCKFDKTPQGLQLFRLSDGLKQFPEMLKASNGFNYWLPGDVCIFLVLSPDPNIELTEMPIDFECRLPNSTKSIVSGFPFVDHYALSCVYPYEKNATVAVTRLTAIFHGGNQLICSLGKVKYCGDLLELTCTMMNGMSGSPVVSNNKIVGLSLGGPVLPGQHELTKSAQLINKNDYHAAWEAYKSFYTYSDLYLPSALDLSHQEFCIHFAWLFEERALNLPEGLTALSESTKEMLKVLHPLPKQRLMGMLIDKVYELMSLLKNKDEICYNVAISCASRCISIFGAVCEQFIRDYAKIMRIEDIPTLWKNMVERQVQENEGIRERESKCESEQSADAELNEDNIRKKRKSSTEADKAQKKPKNE